MGVGDLSERFQRAAYDGGRQTAKLDDEAGTVAKTVRTGVGDIVIANAPDRMMFKDYILRIVGIVLFTFSGIQDAYATHSGDNGTLGIHYDLIVVGMGSGGFGAALAGAAGS